MDHAPPLGLPRGTVRLAEPHPAWAALANAEVGRIRRLINAAGLPPLVLEHIGSTAVPGLVAKPILDFVAGHPAGTGPLDYRDAMAAAGYEHRGARVEPGTHVFVRGPETGRTHHVHVTPVDGPFWNDHLAFRDRLRADPTLVDAYATLKWSLAATRPNRSSYTDGKRTFVEGVVRSGGSAGP